MNAPPVKIETRARILAEALLFWAVTAVSIRLAVTAHFSDDLTAVVKSLALIYLPVCWMVATRRDLARYGLQIPSLRQGLLLFAAVSLLTLLPFWSGNHFWETRVLGHSFRGITFPPRMGLLVAGEVLAVALPEEVFYRGYLQTRLDQAWPPGVRILGASVGWALPVSSAIFVLGHLAVRPALWQLGIFFPSLVFGWMRSKSDSLLPGILYHALCNVGMLILQRAYG